MRGVSTAASVPTTYELEGDEALETLREVGRVRLLRDSFVRFRYADGFSHARALAFQFMLTLVPALIALVGLARVVGQPEVSEILSQTFQDLAPGPAGETLTRALDTETAKAREDAETALAAGLAIAIVSGATAMGQIERGANRIYGVERDRPALRKYAVAAGLALSAGLATVLAFVALVAGDALGQALSDVTGWGPELETAWEIGRWPLGAALVAGAVALVFRIAPNRRQPSASWLVFGSGLAVALWFVFTGALALYISLSGDFGETYGPLAGVMGLLLWSLLTALALFFGLAVAAQLEAARSGSPGPLEDSRPEAEPELGA
jgi:YihY family inner membrane protein